ncbi:glycosyltransferase [Adlercreutzia sp. ZJ138]|uniref:glycosyltransferase n=1 Tax=Adlercreutzia sp. ZJ138 TaxID=2709405 RepID=UPI0013EC3D45|nr:glycosyltransferase [Adlercreutzia sp. ZJ138]
MEIPTYPYDSEMKTLRTWPLLVKDGYHRRYLKNYVDRIVDLSGHDKIFGIPTIQIINGIDLRSISPRTPSGISSVGTLNLACAATFAGWHGIDRLLAGLAKYKQSRGGRKIRLHLMGAGSELRRLKGMAEGLALDDSVAFYGQCDRAQMDEVYDRCSMAIASLGLHRIGIDRASTLKTREYLAKGIPFVYSGEIDVFKSYPVDFCLQVPADESPVDVGKLVEFHDELYRRETERGLISRIRHYAEEHVSMDAAMANVVEYIKENCR